MRAAGAVQKHVRSRVVARNRVESLAGTSRGAECQRAQPRSMALLLWQRGGDVLACVGKGRRAKCCDLPELHRTEKRKLDPGRPNVKRVNRMRRRDARPSPEAHVESLARARVAESSSDARGVVCGPQLARIERRWSRCGSAGHCYRPRATDWTAQQCTGVVGDVQRGRGEDGSDSATEG
ncbi:hypothetical protein ANO11243_039440 [Dothideomycetidae sp. 11243]|nr:hypothetical protein ANO11243_039440 [fungal sp. No.11243]